MHGMPHVQARCGLQQGCLSDQHDQRLATSHAIPQSHDLFSAQGALMYVYVCALCVAQCKPVRALSRAVQAVQEA